MKKITFTFLSILLVVITSSASIEEVSVEKFNKNQENTAVISSRFGEAFIDETTDLSSFQNMQIHHVDLVYTAFRTVEDFDQQALNEHRMQRLIKLLPQLHLKDPTWRAIRQTGATNADDARQYFHGFILHFGETLSYENQSSFFKTFQDEPIVKIVDNSKTTDFTIPSGTTIQIPANAVVDENGNPVKGNYDLEYREFRDQADIVYSGIPMTYSSSGSDYNFSSVGMYEIRANQNGKELKLEKSIQVDFNPTDAKEDVGFFVMNDETGEWAKVRDINFQTLQTDEIVNELVVKGMFIQWSYSEWEDIADYTFSKDLFKLLSQHLDTIPQWKERILEIDTEKLTMSVPSKIVDGFNEAIVSSYIDVLQRPDIVAVADEGQEIDLIRNENLKTEVGSIPKNVGALLAEGSSDPGHTYPNLVKGLNSRKFGVYNCDQIYRIGKPKTLSPKYVDAATGKEIEGKRVTCVLDLSYNGSFSFQPNNIRVNMKGQNVILLFTKDKRTYVLDTKDFDKLKSKSNPVFAMTDMTSEFKSSADLRTYLAR
jgi:hypothetical protein